MRMVSVKCKECGEVFEHPVVHEHHKDAKRVCKQCEHKLARWRNTVARIRSNAMESLGYKKNMKKYLQSTLVV